MKLFIRVTPHAKCNRVEQLDAEHYKVWVTAAPEQGKANLAMIKLLAKHLDIAPSLLVLRAGSTSRHKIVEVDQ